MTATAIKASFHGTTLFIVSKNNEPFVPMRPIVEGMGLTWQSQNEKLKQRFAKGVTEIVIPSAGGKQAMTCLALRKLNGWLQTISPNKVKPEIRARVIQYQEECDDVLYEYWTTGEVKGKSKTTTDDRTPLRDAINMLVGKKGIMYPEAYSFIHQRFNIAHIDELPAEQLPVAIEYVHRLVLEGEFLGKQEALSAPKLELNYGMEFYEQYRWIIGSAALDAPWRYPAEMLNPDGDYPNPIGRMLVELKNAGQKVDAAMFQLQALQHHLQVCRRKISTAAITLQ